MVIVHNIIIRGLNSVYLQAPHVEPKDYGDFIGYALCWHELVQSHHSGEEAILFPGIEQGAGERGIMDRNVHQHGKHDCVCVVSFIYFSLAEEFHPGLNAYTSYLLEAKANPPIFSGTRLVQIIDSFASVLTSHLTDEIPTLVSLSRFGDTIDIETLGERWQSCLGHDGKNWWPNIYFP